VEDAAPNHEPEQTQQKQHQASFCQHRAYALQLDRFATCWCVVEGRAEWMSGQGIAAFSWSDDHENGGPTIPGYLQPGQRLHPWLFSNYICCGQTECCDRKNSWRRSGNN
jgi:hypothetical protein